MTVKKVSLKGAALLSVAIGLLLQPLVASQGVGSEPAQPFGAEGPTPPPNVLIVVTDDQRVHGMDVMPQTQDFFAGQGIRFKKAYATTPLCCPSRASIFTGRFAHNHDVRDTESAHKLRHDTTLESYLKKNGYSTAITGKYLNSWDLNDDPPFFDKWSVFNDDFGVDGYRNERWNVQGQKKTIDRYTTKAVEDFSLDYLDDFETNDEKPWLLYVFPFAPHSPYRPHADYANAGVPPWDIPKSVFEKNLSDKPSWVRNQQESLSSARHVRTGQLRTVMSVDDLMGRLVDRLDDLGESQNTLTFYLSDNGYTWGDHGLLAKRNPYTPAVRVPLYMRWSQVVPATIDDEQPVANIDVAPTVLDAAGVAQNPNRPMDGRSLLEDTGRKRMHLEYFEELGVPSWASTVKGNLQYTEYYGPKGGIKFRELYRLDTDPNQLRNVLKDGKPGNDPSPQKLQTLHNRLADDRKCKGSSCP